jgi:hypothetical protein
MIVSGNWWFEKASGRNPNSGVAKPALDAIRPHLV